MDAESRAERRDLVDEVLTWGMLNVGIALIPIAIAVTFSDKTIMYSSLLAFSITLLTANCYVYENYVLKDTDEPLFSRARKWWAVIFSFCLIGLFSTYNLADEVNNSINDSLWIIVLVTFVFVGISTWLLISPSMGERARRRTVKRRNDERIRQKKLMEKMQEELEGDLG